MSAVEDNLVFWRNRACFGFSNSNARLVVWRKLLGSPSLPKPQSHKYRTQILKDVPRCLQEYNLTDIERHRDRLEFILDSVCGALAGEGLCYIQGLHEVVAIVMLALKEQPDEEIIEMAVTLCVTRLRDALLPSLDVVMNQLNLLFFLVGSADKQLERFLKQSGINPVFALSWTLTWFAHTIPDLETCIRVFDFLVASPPAMSLYMAAGLLLLESKQIQALECDYAEIHGHFKNFPVQHFTNNEFPMLCDLAIRLYVDLPPWELWKLNSAPYRYVGKRSSVLKMASERFLEDLGVYDVWKREGKGSPSSFMHRHQKLIVYLIIPVFLALTISFALYRGKASSSRPRDPHLA